MTRRSHKDSIIVEAKYLTGDNTVKLYVLHVRRESKWSRMTKKIDRFFYRIEPLIIRFSIALVATILLGMILIPVIEIARGYFAFGGEYLCIALFFGMAFKLSKLIIK